MWIDDVRISLLLMSRERVGRLVELFDSIAATTNVPKRVEVLIKIDRDDEKSISLMRSGMAGGYPFKIRFVVGDRRDGYYSSGEVCNQLLATVSPASYYVTVINDRNRFSYKGWDDVLMAYQKHFEHEAFYFRFIGFANPIGDDCFTSGVWYPDDLAIYTRKLIALMEGFGDRWAVSPWFSGILSAVKFKYQYDIAIKLPTSFYTHESQQPTSTSDYDRVVKSREKGHELCQPSFIELSYDRIARNIVEYIQQFPKG